jgi:Fur family ferric uptake transcriptional regulator
MNEQVQILRNGIVQNGFRLTQARKAIVDALVRCDGHITADDLATKVHELAPSIGRMTVYRTLDLLTELGLIRPIYQGTGAAHYILLAGGSHHHFICNRCHKVIEFDRCVADEMAKNLGHGFNFQVQSHLLEVHGLCETCQQ